MPSPSSSRTTLVTDAMLSPVAALRSWRLPGRLKYSDERTTALFSRRRSSTVPRRRCCIAPQIQSLPTRLLYKSSIREDQHPPGEHRRRRLPADGHRERPRACEAYSRGDSSTAINKHSLITPNGFH